MERTMRLAMAVTVASMVAAASASACGVERCGHAHVASYDEVLVDYMPLPPHYVVEHGPLYDGLGVYAAPRVYAPRLASPGYAYVRGYGVGFSGGPYAAGYRYVPASVSRHHGHRRAPLRVYY